ncbi:MAG: hypothetical protein L6Q54_15765 [Leptospiraceae bacterium]|nr:hypothetical protein [Leptospiraceae bacterium]MCK6382693.1 hypothetical protein [Leptospiraceae bacterium]
MKTIYCFNETGLKFHTSNEAEFSIYEMQARAEGLQIFTGEFFPYQTNANGSLKINSSGVFIPLSDSQLFDLGKITIEEVRAKKISEIVAKHDADISAGCTFEGKIFKCDGDTRRMLEEAISIGEFPITWLTKFREGFSLDATMAQSLLNAMRAFVKPIKLFRYEKEALVYSKNSISDIAGITP